MATGPATVEEIRSAVAVVRDVCGRLNPAAIELGQVPAAFGELAALERLAGGAVVRMSARYDESGAWKRDGARSAEEGIGRKTGTTTSKARRNLSTSKRLRSQRRTDRALRNGDVSADQANEVSDATEESPESEPELLQSARTEPLHQLKQRAAEARARADKDREARRRRLQRQRCVRRWNDPDGMGNLLLKLPADELAEIDAALKVPIDRRFADARAAGRFEPTEAYAADVVRERLLGLAGGDSAGGAVPKPNQAVRPDRKVIVTIDARALARGRVEGDEACEIAGVGPVSMAAARQFMSDAFWAIVITDGVDVRNVTHLGRRVTAHQRTALEARGGACEFCGSRFRVEIDHIDGWALTRKTETDDLSLKCRSCHDAKTRHRLREEGPPGNRRLLHPDGRPWRPPMSGPEPPGDPPGDAAAQAVQEGLFSFAT